MYMMSETNLTGQLRSTDSVNPLGPMSMTWFLQRQEIKVKTQGSRTRNQSLSHLSPRSLLQAEATLLNLAIPEAKARGGVRAQ